MLEIASLDNRQDYAGAEKIARAMGFTKDECLKTGSPESLLYKANAARIMPHCNKLEKYICLNCD